MVSEKNDATVTTESLKKEVEQLKKEFAFISQQNLSTYTATTEFIEESMDSLREALKQELSEAKATVAQLAQENEKLQAKLNDLQLAPQIEARIDYQLLADKISDLMFRSELKPQIEAWIDYRLLSEQVADLLVHGDSGLVEGVIKEVKTVMPDCISQALKGLSAEDADAVATGIAEKLEMPAVELDMEALSSEIAEKVALPEISVDNEVLAVKLAEQINDTTYDVLAQKISNQLVQPVADAVEVDYTALATRISDAISEKIENDGVKIPADGIDYALLAQKLLEALPEVDYKTLAERLSEELNGDEVVVKEFVVSHVEETVEEPVEETVEEPVEELVEEPEEVEEPVQELVDEPEEIELPEEPVQEVAAEVVAPIQEAVEEVATASDDATVTAWDEKAIRFKRSYECKLRQADDELKANYNEIKNALCAYDKVKSNISWNGDRFNLGRDTIAKTNIVGKTLCVYLALNPEDFPVTKYHQKYVGDVKAYETTPMMVKVKSGMALKRAVALIDEMLVGMGAVKTQKEPVDYVAEYAYMSDEEMLEAGLIKVGTMTKKDLSSF